MIMKACAAALVAASIGAPAMAQSWEALPTGEGRLCAYADVVGLWDSTLQKADEAGVAQQNAVAPHDYLRFAPNGGMMYFGSSRAISDVARINSRLDELDRSDGETYRAEVAKPGVLIVRRNGTPFQGFTCTISRKAAGKSVMIWTQLKGQPELRRTQVRLD